MTLVLEGKTAVVTGGTSGMGEAITRRFMAEGANVVFGGRNRERGEALYRELNSRNPGARFVGGDVGKEATNASLVQTAAGAFGGIDILVANAGILGLGKVTELSVERWHETVAVNLHSVFYLMRYGIPELEKRGGGTIVVVGSIAAYKGFPNHAAYCATKGALIPLVKQVAVDYAPRIRANILCPGPVDTPLIWSSAEAFPDPSKAVSDVAERTPAKRLGLPSDIASAALFLASDQSSWITGSALTIDGGVSCT